MSGSNPRAVAAAAIGRVADGGRATVVLAAELERSDLSERDRAFATALTLGTVRMQRACNHLLAPHLRRAPDRFVGGVLRMGAFQLLVLGTPRHAAVGETVEVAPKKARGFVNAVLRRVADDLERDVRWPSPAVELSYPDWIVDRFVAELGDDGLPALRAMNDPAQPSARPDGYVHGLASQWVVDEVEAAPRMRIADLCAAPGGKSTGLAAAGADVVAVEVDSERAATLTEVADRFGQGRVSVVNADGRDSGLEPRSFDAVLVDAPCSGLGALGRRADARWRITSDDVDRLSSLQRELASAGAELVRPGGTFVYSVCTITAVEGRDVAAFVSELPGFEPMPLAHADRWRPVDHGGLAAPHDHGTDGMAVFRWRRSA